MSDWISVPTFPDLLVRAAATWPGRDAVVFPDARRTYGELLERAEETARALVALGVGQGDHVGILMANGVDFVEAIFGIALAGAVVVPVNARYKARELSYVVGNADLVALFTSDAVADHADHVGLLHEALPGLAAAPDPRGLRLGAAPRLRAVVSLGEGSPPGLVDRREFGALAATVPAEEARRRRRRVRLRDVALMMYTSGTTAEPKGCPLTHEALVRTALNAGRERFRLTEEDRFWDPLPLFHMSTILPMIGIFDAGAAFVGVAHFEPGSALRYMEKERVTVDFSTFPTIVAALLHHPDRPSTDLSGVRVVDVVAPPDALRAIQAAIPTATVISAYGCTEAGGVIAFNELTDTPEQRATTCGRPFPGIEVEVRDLGSGRALGPDEPGEVVVRGYNLFEGYYKDPAKNAETIEPDGWFHTGDLGSLDPEGRIRYLGRVKDMLKVGGENVAAAEVESYLATHPAVSIVQVVGVPDARLVEVPAAFVQLRPGAEATEQEFIDYCTGKIARFKVPRHVRFVEDWPMSATKIQKFRLREQLVAELGLGG